MLHIDIGNGIFGTVPGTAAQAAPHSKQTALISNKNLFVYLTAQLSRV